MARVVIGPSQDDNKYGKQQNDPGNDYGGFRRHNFPLFSDKKLNVGAMPTLIWIKACHGRMKPCDSGGFNALRYRPNQIVMERA
jgi:hypothetical protein